MHHFFSNFASSLASGIYTSIESFLWGGIQDYFDLCEDAINSKQREKELQLKMREANTALSYDFYRYSKHYKSIPALCFRHFLYSLSINTFSDFEECVWLLCKNEKLFSLFFLYQINGLPTQGQLQEKIIFGDYYLDVDEENVAFEVYCLQADLSGDLSIEIEQWQNEIKARAGVYTFKPIGKNIKTYQVIGSFSLPIRTALQFLLVNPIYIASELMRNSIYHKSADFNETYQFLGETLKLFENYFRIKSLEGKLTNLLMPDESKEISWLWRPDPCTNLIKPFIDFNTLVIVVMINKRYEALGDDIKPKDKLNILADALTQPTLTIRITAEVFRYFDARRDKDGEAWNLDWYISEPGKRMIDFAKQQLCHELNQLPTQKAKRQLLKDMQGTPLFRYILRSSDDELHLQNPECASNSRKNCRI